jgi:adenine-specific DNA-methyltransferase
MKIQNRWDPDAEAILYHADCRKMLGDLPDGEAQLIVTSPPYNIGKPYEKRVLLEEYLERESEVISTSVQKLAVGGSICWQVGNHVDAGEVFPLDILLYPIFKNAGVQLRNRIVWHFEHGLHCSRRLSGRYETILWFTKAREDGSYVFNLDPIRIPQKYPGKKHFKGPNKGLPSANPLGKNPGDFWFEAESVVQGDAGMPDVWIIPNVKHNHIEKTIHPCQFPVELVERLVLALSNPGDLVVDPYMGVGSALVAAVRHGRRAVGSDTDANYVAVARERLQKAADGTLGVRPLGRAIYEPPADSPLTRRPDLADR